MDPVLIVGAGIVGLTLGQALKKVLLHPYIDPQDGVEVELYY